MRPDSEDELSLMQRIAAGDQLAAEEFDRRFRPKLLRFLHRRIPPQDHADVVQETMLAAFRNLQQEKFPTASTLGTWLSGILRHKVADYWETHHRKHQLFAPLGVLDVFSHPGPVTVLAAETAIEVEQRLRALPKRHRVVLVMNLRYRLTTAEISSALKLPSGSVCRILSEAKQMLQRPEKKLKNISARNDK